MFDPLQNPPLGSQSSLVGVEKLIPLRLQSLLRRLCSHDRGAATPAGAVDQADSLQWGHCPPPLLYFSCESSRPVCWPESTVKHYILAVECL